MQERLVRLGLLATAALTAVEYILLGVLQCYYGVIMVCWQRRLVSLGCLVQIQDAAPGACMEWKTCR